MKTHTGKILVDNTRGLKFTESPRWRNGKLWFLDIHDKRIKTADLDGKVETAVELGFIPNGIVITPDGKTLIVAETMGHLHLGLCVNKVTHKPLSCIISGIDFGDRAQLRVRAEKGVWGQA